MTRTCRNCGSEISGTAPFGHCPACLIKLGFGPVPGESTAETTKVSRGRTFGDYELIEQIGRGGMGVVYKARQVALNRLVALKMILAGELASAASVERFHIEAEAAASLNHPNIVPIFDIGEHEGNHYFSMKLVEGESLAKMMPEFVLPKPNGASLPKAVLRQAHSQIARLIATLARAVEYAHQRGILHRDLKPGNILIDAEGTPHLTDFGLAKITSRGDSVTESGDIIGSLSYMAPEQAKGAKVSAAADIYSLGAIFYEMLTGKPPFRAETPVETLRQVTEQEPDRPQGINSLIDPDLATICLKCLEKDPQRRYATARDLAADLDRWERFEPIHARRASIPLRVRRWTRRNRTGTALIGSLCLGLASALAFLHYAQTQKKKAEDAVLVLQDQLSRKIEGIWGPRTPYEEFGSEALAVFIGQQPVLKAGLLPIRPTIGVFIDQNPTETVVEYTPLFQYLEKSMTELAHEPVSPTLRLYRNQKAGAEDLARGEVDILRGNAVLYVLARQKNAGLTPLVWPTGPRQEGVICTHVDSGIHTLADLKGKTLVFGEENSTVTFFAKAYCVEAGIHRSDLAGCKYVHEVQPTPAAEQPDQLEKDQAGYTSSRSVSQIETANHHFDAGVALNNQFFRVQLNKKLAALKTFDDVAIPWVARSNLPPRIAAAFRDAMLKLKDPRVLNKLPDRPDGFAPVSDEQFTAVRERIDQATAFDSGTKSNATSASRAQEKAQP